MNQIHNQDRGRRYIDEVKKFVLTLNFYSPRHLCYNHSAGNHDGYASYGEGIVAPEDDVVAKEVLVFMLVSS